MTFNNDLIRKVYFLQSNVYSNMKIFYKIIYIFIL